MLRLSFSHDAGIVWRKWSFRLTSLSAILAFLGDNGNLIWSIIPEAIREVLPGHWSSTLPGLLCLLAAASAFVDQPKTRARLVEKQRVAEARRRLEL